MTMRKTKLKDLQRVTNTSFNHAFYASRYNGNKPKSWVAGR